MIKCVCVECGKEMQERIDRTYRELTHVEFFCTGCFHRVKIITDEVKADVVSKR